MIGKRVKNPNFGENSECDIAEETDEDGEGKKYINKKTKFNDFNMDSIRNMDNCDRGNEKKIETEDKYFETTKFDSSFITNTTNTY